jgi:hypothetical protein
MSNSNQDRFETSIENLKEACRKLCNQIGDGADAASQANLDSLISGIDANTATAVGLTT